LRYLTISRVKKSSMDETEVEISWALLVGTPYPQCANELRRMVWVSHKVLEGLHKRS
jgi:hypothetical protein